MTEQLTLELRCTIGMATGAGALYDCDWCGTLLYVPGRRKPDPGCPNCGRGRWHRQTYHQVGPFHRGPQARCAREGCVTCGGALANKEAS